MRLNRARSVFEAKKEVGTISGLEWSDLDRDQKESFEGKTITKDELIQCFELLAGRDQRIPSTVGELRTWLRQHLYGNSRKSPNSKFSDHELRKLRRAVEHSRYLEAENVGNSIWSDTNEKRSMLNINGFHYDVTHKQKGKWQDGWGEPTYSSYEMYMLGDRRRLMVLHDLNTDVCRYDHSIVLEEAKDYGPYERWRKESYVRQLEVT